jgi:hypothetical protein
MKARDRARTTRRGRPALALTAAIAVVLSAAPGVAAAADRAVRLTADPSAEACTAFDPLDCSYLMARNGLQPAPDPEAPDAVEPTFFNLATLPGEVTIDGVIHDDGTVTVAEGDVTFPGTDTVRPNALVGDVTVNAQIVQTGAWTGTFEEATGAMSLTVPLSLRFKLTCVPTNGLRRADGQRQPGHLGGHDQEGGGADDGSRRGSRAACRLRPGLGAVRRRGRLPA